MKDLYSQENGFLYYINKVIFEYHRQFIQNKL